MNKYKVKFLFFSCLFMVLSCVEPETVLTNHIHRDGSVRRLIEMRSIENNFIVSNVQVPYDSTWMVVDTFEIIDNENDTMWIRKAEKTFGNIDDINHDYGIDSSHNSVLRRSVSLKKRFRWFNTIYRFSENVDKVMEFGLPVKDFLSKDELNFFYSPEYAIDELKDSPDSLRIRKMKKSVEVKIERWLEKSLISEWIGQFGRLAGKDADQLVKELRDKESVIYDDINSKYSEEFDSLWEAGIIQKDFMGAQNAEKFKTEADSALNIAASLFLFDFKDYSVKTVMPGRLINTNGLIDSTGIVMWPVISEYFITEPYEMWTESKVTNIWAWIVSGLFLLFVLSGIVIRINKKG